MAISGGSRIFWKGVENLKKGVWSVALEVIGISIVKRQNYTLWAYVKQILTKLV